MSYNYPASDSASSPSTSTTNPDSASSATMSFAISPVLVAHVACGALATLLMLPLGVLIPRYGRALNKGRWWFPLHMATQLLGVILVIVALATGYKMGAAEGTAHPGLAIALITGLGLQVVLGSVAHWYKPPARQVRPTPGRGIFHFLHIGLGLVVVMIGWATGLTGFLQQWIGGYGAGLGQFVLGWKIVFGVFIGIFGLGYIGGVVALPSAARQSQIAEALFSEDSEKPQGAHNREVRTFSP